MSNDVRDRGTGRLVREALKAADVTQERAAAALGISQSQLSRRIRGHITFRIDEIITLAVVCGVSPSALVATDGAAA